MDERKTQGDDYVSTHSSHYYKTSPLIRMIKTKQLSDIKIEEFDVIGVDESQFFTDLYDTVKKWVNTYHKTVYCAGLDGDRHMKPFGQILSLIPLADQVTKQCARCSLCLDKGIPFKHAIAPFTYGIAPSCETQIRVGGAEAYQAVCRFHYLELNKDKEQLSLC